MCCSMHTPRNIFFFSAFAMFTGIHTQGHDAKVAYVRYQLVNVHPWFLTFRVPRNF